MKLQTIRCLTSNIFDYTHMQKVFDTPISLRKCQTNVDRKKRKRDSIISDNINDNGDVSGAVAALAAAEEALATAQALAAEQEYACSQQCIDVRVQQAKEDYYRFHHV